MSIASGLFAFFFVGEISLNGKVFGQRIATGGGFAMFTLVWLSFNFSAVRSRAGDLLPRAVSPDNRMRVAQRELKDRGLMDGHANGVRDSETTRAIIEFQRQNNLAPSGILTSQTYELLRSAAQQKWKSAKGQDLESKGMQAMTQGLTFEVGSEPPNRNPEVPWERRNRLPQISQNSNIPPTKPDSGTHWTQTSAIKATSKPVEAESTQLDSRAVGNVQIYVGTFTNKHNSKGIFRYTLDTTSGAVSGGERAAEAVDPFFLALHPNGRVLYAALMNSSGAVGAFAIQADGKLQALNQQSSRGDGACYVWVDGAGKNVLVANYGGGSIAALPIQQNGSLAESSGFAQHTGSSVNPNRQKEPHAHSIYTDASNRFAYVCDLGLDKVLIYRFDADKGTLTPNEPPFVPLAPGSGPRHLAFHPSDKYAYVINEMLNTVTVFQHDATSGKLTEVQTIPTLPDGFKGENFTAEILVHLSGKFVYGSNCGHDSIVVYIVDQTTGKLTLVEHVSTQGKGPRNFAIDPTGQYLIAANQQTDNAFVYRIDNATGKLTATGHGFKCDGPACIVMQPVR